MIRLACIFAYGARAQHKYCPSPNFPRCSLGGGGFPPRPPRSRSALPLPLPLPLPLATSFILSLCVCDSACDAARILLVEAVCRMSAAVPAEACESETNALAATAAAAAAAVEAVYADLPSGYACDKELSTYNDSQTFGEMAAADVAVLAAQVHAAPACALQRAGLSPGTHAAGAQPGRAELCRPGQRPWQSCARGRLPLPLLAGRRKRA